MLGTRENGAVAELSTDACAQKVCTVSIFHNTVLYPGIWWAYTNTVCPDEIGVRLPLLHSIVPTTT